MANAITLRKTYSTLLDEAYKLASLTAVLDGPNDLAQEGANANEILIPKMSMSGLADYDKQTGYALGDVTLDYETKKCDYDRGRMFTVDAMDNIESAGIAFGRLSGEFLRTQVVPELDTWRLAKYAGYASGNNVATGAIADGKAGIAAIRAGKTAIKNAEAKTETCYLFISTTLKGMIDDLDTTASKKAMEDWAGVIEVPASRFFDKVTLTKTGAGGFATTGGKAINFLIVGSAATRRFSSVILPSFNGTLKSHLQRTRCPFTLISSTDFLFNDITIKPPDFYTFIFIFVTERKYISVKEI